VLKEASKTFEANSKEVEDEAFDSDEVDWISLAAKRKCLQLEDAHTKSSRLRLDGITLAEAERLVADMLAWCFVFYCQNLSANGMLHVKYFTLTVSGYPVHNCKTLLYNI